MKNLIVILSAMFVTAHAEARSVMPFKKAAIINFNIQEGSHLSNHMITRGDVIIAANNEITLSLGSTIMCVRAPCPQPPPSVVVTVPVYSKTIGSCGETIYQAEKDLRSVDGVLTKITVVDNSTIKCRIMVPQTQITLDYSGGMSNVNEVHTFEAMRLQGNL
jgi:hypothetical protein